MASGEEGKISTLPNPLTGTSADNPLGWPGANMPPSTSGSAPGGPSLFGAPTNPFAGVNTPAPSPVGGGALAGNLAQQNYMTGALRNQLLPIFAKLFGSSTGPAMDFFKKLMDLGSPYYKEQQRASLESGVNSAENTSATARQRVNASGYGYAPSGLEAGVIGQEAVGESQNLSQMFLQNLFQNENLQMGGAQGLSALAQLFNPANLTGQSTTSSIQQPTNTAAEIMSSIGTMAGGIFGAGGIPKGGGGGNG